MILQENLLESGLLIGFLIAMFYIFHLLQKINKLKKGNNETENYYMNKYYKLRDKGIAWCKECPKDRRKKSNKQIETKFSLSGRSSSIKPNITNPPGEKI